MTNTIAAPTFIDLFAGCGGLSLGLEKAGFYPLFVNELNSDALETYLKNRDQHHPHLREEFFSKDIKDVIKDERFFDKLFSNLTNRFGQSFKTGEVDVVAGGPPCQGFSGIGIRRSYSVDKKQLPSNHLYQDMAFFVHSVRPKIFLFENVEGLLRAKWTSKGTKGEIFSDVLKTFKAIEGYQVRTKLIHAKDYGVPQNRPRVLIVGIRDDLMKKTDTEDAIEAGFIPSPSGSAPNLEDVLSDLIDPDFSYGGSTEVYVKSTLSDWQRQIRVSIDGQLKKRGMPLTEQEYSNHSDIVRQRFSAMISNGGKIPEELRTKKFAQRLLPKQWGEQGPSITACSLPDDFVHYEQARTLTVREWARLQTFPDWYQFAGKRTTGGLRRAGNPRQNQFEREVPKYTQIGNAVPVVLGEKLGDHFKSIIA